MLAYQIFEDETSKATGLPLWIARWDNPDIAIMVEERRDLADAALAEWDEKESKRKKRRHGIVRFPVAYGVDAEPLEYGGAQRHAFYKQIQQEAEDLALGLDIERRKPPGGYDPNEYGD